MTSKEEFIDFWNNNLDTSCSPKNVKKLLEKYNKHSFDGYFDIYYWVMKLQRSHSNNLYERMTFEEMIEDPRVELTEQKREKIKQDSDIHIKDL